MTDIVKHEEPQIIHLPAVTPMSMIERAVERGADVAMIEKLMELQERHEANLGRRAFDQAIAKAKAEFPPIVKNRHVKYDNKTGGKTDYRHEDLAEIAKTVDPILSRYGLSYRFRTMQDGAQITVTCIVSHEAGYSEETALSGAADASGGKNAIQAVGSSVTYLQRYTLKSALGLAASADDDGAAAGRSDEDQNITQDQYVELQSLIEKSGLGEKVVLDAEKISALHFLPARRFGIVKTRLENTGKNRKPANV